MKRLTKKMRNTNQVLTARQYQKLREQLGTQVEVAKVVGVAPDTIRKRERGVPGYPITREATVTMLAVAGVWTPAE